MQNIFRAVTALTIAAVPAVMSACGGGPAPGCHYALSAAGVGIHAPGTASGPGGIGPKLIDVTAPSGCTWTYQSNDAWITVAPHPPASAGSGNGRLDVTVAANTGVRRVGTVTVAFQTFTIDQAGSDGAGACTFSIYPTAATVGPAGAPGAFAIVAGAPDCAWWSEAPSPDDDFVDRDYHSGLGNGLSTYQFVPTTTFPSLPAPRTARIRVHDSTDGVAAEFRVTQTP